MLRSAARRLLRGGLLALPLLALGRPAASQDPLSHMEWGTTAFVLLDQLEYAPIAAGRPLTLDATGWIGGAYNRLWFRVDADQHTAERDGEAEAQLLYGRSVAPFWDALVGVRVDRRWGHGPVTRAHLAVGVEGLAPYWFEVAPTLFVSQRGDVAARLQAEYELLLTQRAVLTPELEVNAALQAVEDWGVGAGLNDYGMGLRLRYELRREFAPYAGWRWSRRLGETAQLARADEEPVKAGALVAGLRMWF